LRRRKNDVEDVLPERSDKTYFVPMLPEQEVRYNELSGQVAKILAKTKRRRLTKEELDKLQRLLACMRMT
jgi:SNF2 family DNA or RNA helicase